jgi:ketosteroid isomerase-like protein
MTSRAEIEKILTSLYTARARGDVDRTVADLAEDAQFGIYAPGIGGPGLGAPLQGKPAIKQAVQGLVAAWRFDNWESLDMVIDGEKAVVRWSADVTNTQSGKQARLQCVDLIRFTNGKIVDYHQSTDTAMMMKMMQ